MPGLFVGTRSTLLNSAVPTGALRMLYGEAAGLAIDFTTSHGFGQVAVKGHTTNYDNVPVDSFLTNSGTSPKLVRNATGTYVWSAHNLFLNSAAPATQNVTLIVGATYTVTVTGAGGGSITGSAGASGVATTGTPATFTATTTTGTFTYAATLTTIQLNRGSVATTYMATVGSAKFAVPMDYDSGWAALVEPAATNLCLQSQDFTTTWTNTNTDEPTTNNTAPDGLATADEIAATLAANQAFAIYQGFTGLTAGNTATCSVFLKAGTNATLAQLAWDANGAGADGCFCNFNLSTGAKGTVTALAAGTATSSVITSVGNGWYRCSITGKIAVGTVGRFTISIVDLITEAVFGAANLADNDSIIAWQGQVEATASSASTIATSPIQTFAAAVTRAADNVNVATTAFPLGSTYSMMADFSSASVADGRYIMTLSDGTVGDFSGLRSNSSQGQLGVVDGSSTQASISAGTLTNNVRCKIAGRVTANNFAVSTDASAVATDVSGTMPTVNILNLGQADTSGQLGVKKLHRLVIVPRGWTDAELQTRTAA